MTARIPEPARAWAWHTARVLAALVALTVILTAGALLILTIAHAIAGTAPWWIPAGLVGLGGLLGGTASWWLAGGQRP
jgi:hypothetical protein